MSKEVEPIGEPLQFHGSATHYCKLCCAWGSQEDDDRCGSCGTVGYLMRNPFPNNLVPYVVLRKPTVAAKLTKNKE